MRVEDRPKPAIRADEWAPWLRLISSLYPHRSWASFGAALGRGLQQLTGAESIAACFQTGDGKPACETLIGTPVTIPEVLPVRIGDVWAEGNLTSVLVHDTPGQSIWLLFVDAGRWNLAQVLARISPEIGLLIASAWQSSGIRQAAGIRLRPPPAEATLASSVRRELLSSVLNTTVEATGRQEAVFISEVGQGAFEVACLASGTDPKVTSIEDEEISDAIAEALDAGRDLTLNRDMARRLAQIAGLAENLDWFYLRRIAHGESSLGLLGVGMQVTQSGPMAKPTAAALSMEGAGLVSRPRLQQAQVIEQLRILAREVGEYFERSGIRDHAYLQGMVEERSYVGIDLHDSILQDLTYLQLQLGRLEESLDRDPAQTRELLAQWRSVLTRASREARELSVGLASSQISEDLVDVLSHVLDRFRSRFDGNADLKVDGVQRLTPPVLNGQLMRIFQELLNNVWKHAAATQVDVELRFEQRQLRLIVADNGRGFLLEEPGAGQLGLRGIEKRAALIDAQFDIQSEVGQGTTVTVTVPL